jgi:decaprenylphospho-beta-D-erythro-pentofuranosid-2-ulose 2-reductase
MQKILIIGATSAIAQEVCHRFLQQGKSLFLVGRNESRLKIMVQDFKVRYNVDIPYFVCDLVDFKLHKSLLDKVISNSEGMGGLDAALIAHGILPDQKLCQKEVEQLVNSLDVNMTSVFSLLTHLANYFENKRAGIIAVISSVAGDRGRQSNYVYGAAKGALNIFLDGLSHRLYGSGVNVLTIKPGFVDTPMTQDFKKGLLWAKPEKVAKDIVQAMNKGKRIIYTPSFWRLIMFVIKIVPRKLFYRTSL